jgi:hypothetical protein
VGFLERLAGQAGGDEAAEVWGIAGCPRAGSAGRVRWLAGGLDVSNVLIELDQLASRQPPPLVECDITCGHECLLLGE